MSQLKTLPMILRSHTRHSKLPLELIDHIIDYLHDSPEDLHTCALVCKAWLESSRSHIFYSVSIYSFGKAKTFLLSRYKRLHTVIRRSPHIALHVRELHIDLQYHHRNPSNSTFLQIEKILPLLLRSFTRLHKLDIGHLTLPLFGWDCRKSLQDLVALSSLIRLEVDTANFDDLLSLLQPSLKHLSISGYLYNLTEPLHSGGEQERQPCRLETLTLGGMHRRHSSALANWLLGPQSIIDISNIRTLSAPYCLYNDKHDIMRLVRSLGSSLEHLVFQDTRGFLWSGLF
jgi:hypothetical protein